MGLLSDTLVDPNEEDKSSQEFFTLMTEHTRRISNMMSPGNFGAENKIFHHLVLTQKLLSQKRGSPDQFTSPMGNFVRTYLDTLPVEDMSSLIYWDQTTLNQVDSEIIR